MASWGNALEEQKNQNMVSPNGYYLKVTDANQNDVALFAKNSKDPAIGENDPNARALKAEGMAEIIANAADNPASTGLKVTNASTDVGAKAILAEGNSVFIGRSAGDPSSTALEVGNTSDNANAYAMWSLGQHRMAVDGGMENAITALHVINESTESNALALKVEGVSELAGDVVLNNKATFSVEDVNDDNDDKIAAHFVNSSNNPDARALKVEGKTEIESLTFKKVGNQTRLDYQDGYIKIGTSLDTLGIEIGNTDAPIYISSDNTTIEGQIRVSGSIESFNPEEDLSIGSDENYTRDVIISRSGQTTTVNGGLLAKEILRVGPVIGDGKIDSGGVDLVPQDLYIGTENVTRDVTIGRADKTLYVRSDILIGVDHQAAKVNANFLQDLEIGTFESTRDVLLGRNAQKFTVNSDHTFNKGELRTGPSGDDGFIDSGGSALTPQGLKIGTQNVTADLYVSRDGQTTFIQGELNIAEDVNAASNLVVGPGDAAANIDAAGDENLNVGTAGSTADVVIGQGGQDAYVRSDVLKVGPTAGAGSINSGGAPGAPMDLKIGDSSDTANLVLLNGSNLIDLKSNTRLNSKEFVVNGATSLSAGCGFVYNATGHGAGESIDFYIGGNMVGYIDSAGWH